MIIAQNLIAECFAYRAYVFLPVYQGPRDGFPTHVVTPKGSRLGKKTSVGFAAFYDNDENIPPANVLSFLSPTKVRSTNKCLKTPPQNADKTVRVFMTHAKLNSALAHR